MARLAYIQITRRCNEQCLFCSNPPYDATLPFDEGKFVLDKYIEQGYEGVILSGGEPTLSEDLPAYLRYCRDRDFYAKMITNGQKLASHEYARRLKEAGLYHLSISLYSQDPEIMAFITQKRDALAKIMKALRNLEALGDIIVDINIVINKYNADHLSKIAGFVVERFPFVRHFVFNNLDPYDNWASVNTDTIPRLNDFELELHRALRLLEAHGKSFRVERVPLCYMAEYAHFSTETRRIVKGEGKAVYFLDERGLWTQGATHESGSSQAAIERAGTRERWPMPGRRRVQAPSILRTPRENVRAGTSTSLPDLDPSRPPYYGKAQCCKVCSVNDICAGLYEMDTYYSSKELYPLFVDKEAIVRKILLS